MKRLLAVIAVSVLAVSPCQAIIDLDLEWSSFVIRVVTEGEQVEIVAATKANRLSHLELRTQVKNIVVPSEELVRIPPVLLRTLRVVSPDTQIRPGVNVRLEFQLVPLQASEQTGVAKFGFAGGRYTSWFVERTVDGKLVSREMKEAGKPPQPVR